MAYLIDFGFGVIASLPFHKQQQKTLPTNETYEAE
jgi:hypothetical protein